MLSLTDMTPSFLTDAYHLDQPGFCFSEILVKPTSAKDSEIVLHGGAGPVISISTSPILHLVPAFIKVQSSPSIVKFSPVLPGLIGFPSSCKAIIFSKENITKNFGEILFDSFIRSNADLASAPSHFKSIFDYSPNSYGANDYKALGNEIIKRIKKETK